MALAAIWHTPRRLNRSKDIDHVVSLNGGGLSAEIYARLLQQARRVMRPCANVHLHAVYVQYWQVQHDDRKIQSVDEFRNTRHGCNWSNA